VGVGRADQDPAAPVDIFQGRGRADPERREDHDVARGRLMLRSSTGIRAQSGDEITKRLRPARIRNDNLVIRADQMPAECPGHRSGANEANPHREILSRYVLRVDTAAPG
jgi:hypothetical protein